MNDAEQGSGVQGGAGEQSQQHQGSQVFTQDQDGGQGQTLGQSGSEGQRVEGQSAPSMGLDLTALREAVGAAVREVVPRQETQQPALSQAEIDAALKVYRPSVKTVERLLAGGDDALAAMNEVVSGVSAHAAQLLQVHLQHLRSELDGRFQPLQGFVAQQQQERLKQQFLAKHADLADYEPVLESVRDQLIREGAKFKTVDECFTEVAKRARTILKLPLQGAAGGQSNNGSQQKTQGQSQRPAMSTLTGGGQGAGGKSGGSGQKPLRETIFD